MKCVHVIPINDSFTRGIEDILTNGEILDRKPAKHTPEIKCECDPSVHFEEGVVMVYHSARDRREEIGDLCTELDINEDYLRFPPWEQVEVEIPDTTTVQELAEGRF